MPAGQGGTAFARMRANAVQSDSEREDASVSVEQSAPVGHAPTLPRRPAAVRYGVPYLVVMWAAIVGSVVISSGGGEGPVLGMAFWTLIWYAVLYRTWRGGPMAIAAVTVLTTLIPVVLIIGVVAVAIALNGQLFGGWRDIPASMILVMIGWAGALVVGIGLRRSAVREWSAALRPPRTRAEAAVRGGSVPVGARAVSGSTARAAVPGDPGHTDEGGSGNGIEEIAIPVTLDLGTGLRSQAKAKLGCFGLVMAFFPGLPLVVGAVTFIREGDPQMMLSVGGFLLVFVAALCVSVLRFRRRLGAGSVLTIDRSGLTWQGGGEPATMSWNGLAGIGISYHMARTKGGKKMHMPQLDIYEQVASPPGRWPELDSRRRRETPPDPKLPAERFRLMLPMNDDVHRRIEAAVQASRPQLWLGWYERRRSDSPWFLR